MPVLFLYLSVIISAYSSPVQVRNGKVGAEINRCRLTTRSITTMKTSTPTHETIELDITDMYQPISLDLNQVFGAIGLSYTVALESYGLVRVHKTENQAQITLSAGAYAEAGSQTRLIVRADDGTGCTAAVIFKLSIVDSSAEISCVA